MKKNGSLELQGQCIHTYIFLQFVIWTDSEDCSGLSKYDNSWTISRLENKEHIYIVLVII